MLLDIVKRNMIYKNLETVSDLIQRNEKRDNKQKKVVFYWYQQTKIRCVQVFKPTFNETTIIFL